MVAPTSPRPSPIAGKWYPADPQRLASTVDQYMQSAHLPTLAGRVIAVVAPHAGHRFSGPVAGYAFAALRGMRPELVAVVSPMHYPYSDSVLTTAHPSYQTPLGEIPVDQAALTALDEALRGETGKGITRIANDEEHSLEIELPFLQRALAAPFSLLPLMVRDATPAFLQTLGHCLATVLAGKSAIMVASTDLSHFCPQNVAQAYDDEMMRRLADFDPEGLLRAEAEGKGFACGRAAVAAVLWAARELGGFHVRILHHATSGDVTGDYSQVVGYASAAILAPPSK